MKTIFFGALFFFWALVFSAAAGISEEARRSDERAEMSYAFGMLIASELVDTGLEFNYYAFMRGFRDILQNNPQHSMEEAIAIVNAAFNAARAALVERNRVLAETFLAENSARAEVNVLPSGVQYEVITEGMGAAPGPRDIVLVHYHGTTIDGVVFDTTLDMGFPVEIPLDRVIPGWTEGLLTMREGGRSIIYIPPHLAYGESGAGTIIGPNEVLIFDIEFLEIVQSFADIDDQDEWRPLLDGLFDD